MRKKTDKKVTSKQVVAMVGVILLVLLYVVTLFVAIIDRSASGNLFIACLVCSISIPILIWIYTWLYGKVTGKPTIANYTAKQPTPEDILETSDSSEVSAE